LEPFWILSIRYKDLLKIERGLRALKKAPTFTAVPKWTSFPAIVGGKKYEVSLLYCVLFDVKEGELAPGHPGSARLRVPLTAREGSLLQYQAGTGSVNVYFYFNLFSIGFVNYLL
jgi:hypothetical protein